LPCDLLVTNGKSEIDQTVSNLIFANRIDDIGQPIFVMALGVDPTNPVTVAGFHVGVEADPNGLISGVGPGSFYASTGTPSLWQIQADDTTWVQISDDLGGENLSETLAIGDFTGGQNIVITSGDSIIGAENSVGGAGATVNIVGGPATGVTGDGGRITLTSGTTVGGDTGNLQFTTPTPGGSGSSGGVLVQTGTSLVGGNGGEITLRSGGGAQGGEVNLYGGAGPTGTDRGGRIGLWGGDSLSTGDGASINIVGGSATTPPAISNVFNAGQGGNVNLWGGNSADAVDGGWIVLQAGSGGPGGGEGGVIRLRPGSGGGGADDGIVQADGIFQSDNIKRGTGDPNAGGGTPGDEGDVYQRLDTGIGELWVNKNGSATGWLQLAFAGDFIESFNQMQWGYLSPAAKNVGGGAQFEFDSSGILNQIQFDDGGTAGTISRAHTFQSGSVNSFSLPAPNDFAAFDMDAGAGLFPHRASYKFAAHFSLFTTDTSDTRIFMGFSTATGFSQLAVNNADPAGAEEYIGFVADPGTNPNWRVIARGPGGPTDGPSSTGVTIASTSSVDVWHFIIDTSQYPTIQFFIFDESLNLLSSNTLSTSVPGALVNMGMIIGSRRINPGGGNVFVGHSTVVNQKGTVADGAGVATGGLTLAEVLINGNESGLNNIVFRNSFGIAGELDGNGGDGANVNVFSGFTSLAGNDTGFMAIGSAGRIFVGGSGNTNTLQMLSGGQFDGPSTGDTGTTIVGTGFTAGSGDTGDLSLLSGNAETGTTGDVLITTGVLAVSGTQGSVLIAPGTTVPNPATTTGTIVMKGGSTSLAGVTGGDVLIFSGEASGATGDTGDIIVETFDVNLDGNSGRVELSTGDGGINAGDSGFLNIRTGDAIAGNTGFLGIATGTAGNGTGGTIIVSVGDSTSGAGSNITVAAGDTSDAAALGGDISLTPGTGGLGNGAVIVNGKLTVTGAIDPTALLLEGQAIIPPEVIPNASQGTLWVDNTGPSGQLIYTNSDGDNNITTGGGATALNDLTDVTIAAPAPGEVLMLNGALQWVNAVGFGGAPLDTILVAGNTTGNLPIVVEDSLGSRITSDGNLTLDPAVAGGNAVIIDGLLWPEADGVAGQVLTTNGAGQLSFQPGGGGGGGTFAEAFAQMQFGQWVAIDTGAVPIGGGLPNITGFFGTVPPLEPSPGPGTTVSTLNGVQASYVTLGVADSDAGLQITGSTVADDSKYFTSIKFVTGVGGAYNMFAGLTTASGGTPFADQLAFPGTPNEDYVGVQLVDDQGQINLHFVTDNASGAPLTVDTGILPSGSTAFWIDIDSTVVGAITLSLYDVDRNLLAATTFNAQLPSPATLLSHMAAVRSRDAVARFMSIWSVTCITRADLLGAIGGGGGNQDLASVLGFGRETGGLTIQGDDSGAGSGVDLSLAGGTSTGGGGAGGDILFTGGAPDPAGIGGAGNLVMATGGGAGTGDGGDLSITLGPGGPGGGSGGSILTALGDGAGTGSGGIWSLTAGDSGPGIGSFAGAVNFTTGSGGVGSGAAGGRFNVITGAGDGTGNGGGVLYTTGAGGAGGGDGGSFIVSLGIGNGGGVDGKLLVVGDVDISGKLTVGGMIDPPGLLMSSSGVVPFTPAGSEGGIWVNNSGELIFTNTGGDLNLSTAIGGGLGFLDALLISGYGFMGPGNPIGGPESYGVYGGSVNFDVDPPGAITFGTDPDGPLLVLSLGAVAGAQAYESTADLTISRDQQFKALFKFQSSSPAHTDERIFIGFTDDASLTTPATMLASPAPVGGLQYMGLYQSLGGVTFEFIAQGSGGAMVNVFALPNDGLVHYLQIDASASSGDVTFTVFDSDGVTISNGGLATHTEPDVGFVLPDLSLATRPFVGLASAVSTTPRTLDFYFSSIITRADVVDSVVGLGGGGGGISPLEDVLGAGDITNGNDIEFTDGDKIRGEDLGTGTGGSVDVVAGDETVGGVGTAGGDVGIAPGSVTAGVGGRAGTTYVGASVSVGSGIDGSAGAGVIDGGDGADLLLFSGSGGLNLTGDGGAAGTFNFLGGNGGAADEGASPNNAGNGTDIIFFGGSGGDGNHSAGEGRGGDSGDFAALLGIGGDGVGTTAGLGGFGGDLSFFSGAGGDGTAVASGIGTGRAAGDLAVLLGSGGDGTGVDGGVAGDGGVSTTFTGPGGDAISIASGTATAGDGGSWDVLTGPGGNGTGFAGATAGVGGDFTAVLGDGGIGIAVTSGTGVGALGGGVALAGGGGGDGTGVDGGTGGAGGSYAFVGGFGADGTAITTGTGTGGAGGDFEGALGFGGVGTGRDGGVGGAGGHFAFAPGGGGDAVATVAGTATGGLGGGFLVSNGDGGDSSGIAGVPSVAGAGGEVLFDAGDGGDGIANDIEGGAGGDVTFIAGAGGIGIGTETGGAGGIVTVFAGDGGGGTAADGLPGDVVIGAGAPATPGAGPGPAGGKITLGAAGNDDALDDDAPALKFGSITIPAGPWPGPTPILYTSPLPVGHAARSIQLTVEATPAEFPAAAMTAFVITGSNGGAGFTFDIFPPPPGAGPITIHWVAFT
jgi:hypothetical protein